METAPKNPIDMLIFLTASLIDIMNREIELLRNMQPQEIRELQDEKAELARAYETCMQHVKSDPSILAAASRPVKAQLKELTTKFQSVMIENERALRAVKSVSERLLTVIVNAVSEKQNGSAYTSSGAIGAAAMAGSKSAGPIAVNERL